MQLIKGKTSCNRTACQTELINGAIYYNSSTEANYCPKCAYLINKHNPNLCILVKANITNTEKHNKIIIQLKEELKAIHPIDGLNSPRDIELTKGINLLSHILDEIESQKV